jgi:rhodanese-related sulfurtransferase
VRIATIARATLCPWLLVLAACGSGGGKSAAEEPKRGYRSVLPPIAFEMLRDTPELVAVDLREHEEFLRGHLNHAFSLPLSQLDQRIEELKALRDSTFLVYCRAEGDDCGERGVVELRLRGYRDAVLIEGGIEGWLRYGFGTVEGTEDAGHDHRHGGR